MGVRASPLSFRRGAGGEVCLRLGEGFFKVFIHAILNKKRHTSSVRSMPLDPRSCNAPALFRTARSAILNTIRIWRLLARNRSVHSHPVRAGFTTPRTIHRIVSLPCPAISSDRADGRGHRRTTKRSREVAFHRPPTPGLKSPESGPKCATCATRIFNLQFQSLLHVGHPSFPQIPCLRRHV